MLTILIPMDLVTMRELDKKTIEAIFERAGEIERGKVREKKGIVATAFFEPSTRTSMTAGRTSPS